LTYTAGVIFGKAFADWKFVNASTDATAYEWSVNGNVNNPETEQPFITQDAQKNGIADYVGIGWYHVPQLKASAGASSSTYKYGDDASPALANSVLVGCDDVYSLSAVDLSYMQGWYVQTGTYNYYFGNPMQSDMYADKGLGVYYEKPHAPLSINAMGVHLYSKVATLIPADSPLKMTIYPQTSDGKIDWSNPIGSSEIYANDIVEAFKFSSGVQVYYARFTFSELDPISGLKKSISLLLDQAFVAVLSFDTTKADFGVLFTDAPHVPYIHGTSVMIVGDTEYALRDDENNNECDMAFEIEGLFNTLEIDEASSSTLHVAAEGGYAVDADNYYGTYFYSSLPFDEDIFEITTSDWLSVDEYSNDDYEEYAVFLLTVKGESNPGSQPRTGTVTVSSYGVSATITVTQDGGAGIISPNLGVTSVTRNGSDYVLRYPTSVTSVAVYNVTGQIVAEYKLDGSGKFTLPTAQLRQGAYVLKFNNANTFKILK
jgi:hypothetical protein